MKPVLRHKAELIQRLIDDLIIEFSRNVNPKNKDIREELYQILNSKSWTNNLSLHQHLYGFNVRYIDMVANVGISIRSRIIEFIELYKENLSEEQIKAMEDLLRCRYSKMQASSVPLTR